MWVPCSKIISYNTQGFCVKIVVVKDYKVLMIDSVIEALKLLDDE